MKQYWLMKSEPGEYSIDDLKKYKTTGWDGVRNYQARNFMRDQMRMGDGVFFYHSNAKPGAVGIAGQAKVCKAAYPDDTAWDPEDKHFDPKSSPENPIWFRVDVRFVKKSREIITLQQLKATPGLEKMVVTQKGSRLSVQPVSSEEWDLILKMPQWA